MKKTGKSIPFFNKGPKNKWQEVLDENNQKKLKKSLKKKCWIWGTYKFYVHMALHIQKVEIHY